jgi:hypothetical protein
MVQEANGVRRCFSGRLGLSAFKSLFAGRLL